MDFGVDNSFAAVSSTFYGAIFMSNRATKRECLKRKLFGLPRSQISFVKKIKSGMTLFLFEYEERKLYGVYEATCDGALDIDPGAFTSSGKYFTAQIRVRIISFPPPLSEHEFSDAIKDNYYTVNKFNFYLSREQVDKLIELFNARETNIQRSLSSGTRKKGIKRSKEYVLSNNLRITFKNDTVENDTDMGKDVGPASLSSYPDPCRPNLNRAGYYKKSIPNTNDHCAGDSEPLSLTFPHSSELWMSDPITSHTDDIVKLSDSSHHDHPYYRGALSFQLRPLSLSLGDNDIHRSMQDITVYPECSTDGSYAFSRMHLHQHHRDPDALDSSSIDYLSLNVAHNPEEYKFSTDPKDDEPSSLHITSSRCRYFERKTIHSTTTHSTCLEGYEFHDRCEPFFPISRTRSIGIKRVGDSLLPCNHGTDPSHLCEYCYHVSSLHGGGLEKAKPWSADAVLSAKTEDFGRIKGPFHFSSIPESSYHEDHRGLSFHHPPHDEEYCSSVMFSELKSDTYKEKSSVFSRLSFYAEESAQETYESHADLTVSGSMHQVQMKKEWKHVIKKSGNGWNAGSHIESTADMDMSVVDAIDNEGELEENKGTANDNEIPFLNFKRRSQAQKTASEMKTQTCVEGVSSGKSKRRKLIRPPFNELSSSVEGTAKYLPAEWSSQELGGSFVLDLDEGKVDAELSEALNRKDGEDAGEYVLSQEPVICQKSATNAKANKGFRLESLMQLPVGDVRSEGNTNRFSTHAGNVSPPSLICKGETLLQGEGNTNGSSEVVMEVDETFPLGKFDSQKNDSFKARSELNVLLSFNEGNEGQMFEGGQKNEVVMGVHETFPLGQFNSQKGDSFKGCGEPNVVLSINEGYEGKMFEEMEKNEVAMGVHETFPLGQFDSQKDDSFKECGEPNVVLSINEVNEGKMFEETKKNEVVMGVNETFPLGQCDSQKDDGFKECTEPNVVLSINEGNEGKMFDDSKKNEVVMGVHETFPLCQFDSQKDDSFKECSEPTVVLSINEGKMFEEMKKNDKVSDACVCGEVAKLKGPCSRREVIKDAGEGDDADKGKKDNYVPLD